MEYPDILGWELDKAVGILKNNGFKYEITMYSPPQKFSNKYHSYDKPRIVRVKQLEEKTLQLIVCNF